MMVISHALSPLKALAGNLAKTRQLGVIAQQEMK
jgi:hypothetical protein